MGPIETGHIEKIEKNPILVYDAPYRHIASPSVSVLRSTEKPNEPENREKDGFFPQRRVAGIVLTGDLRSCSQCALSDVARNSVLRMKSAEGGIVEWAEVVEGGSIGVLVKTLVGAGEFGVRCYLVAMRRAGAHGLRGILEDAGTETGELGSTETDSFRYISDGDAAVPQ